MLKLSVQFMLSTTSALFFVLSLAGWRSGKRDIAIDAGGLGFNPRASQIEHSWFYGVRCCVAQEISPEMDYSLFASTY